MTTLLTSIPLITLMALVAQQSHLLMTLLTLESLILSLVLLIPFILSHTLMNLNSLSIIILSFSACEASLGLSLLVLMSRSMGSDLLHNLTLNKC